MTERRNFMYKNNKLLLVLAPSALAAMAQPETATTSGDETFHLLYLLSYGAIVAAPAGIEPTA
jgi:hypothetical protein